jgi:predicted RNA binding protein YcfA (HicA-like mRNA interferase family)
MNEIDALTGWSEFFAVLGFAAAWLVVVMLAIFKPWAWALARDTGVHRYYQHPDGRRRVVRVRQGHQPIDRAWLAGGDWSRSPRGPSWLVAHYNRHRRPAPRFSLLVDGELLEADSFGGIIEQLRERGFTTDDLVAAALVVHHTPTGAEFNRVQ